MGWCLVVLAAGKGSRFGGPKQLAPVGPADEPLLVLSLRDAFLAGASYAVIVTRAELLEPIQAVCAQFIGDRSPIRFAIQSIDDLPVRVQVAREKPWGTGHAVWAARQAVEAPFAVINADDYYGVASMRLVGDAALRLAEGEAAIIAYRLANTLSETGGVSRAICELENGMLVSLQETYDVRRLSTGIFGRRDAEVEMEEDMPASINLWAFHSSIFNLLSHEFERFLQQDDLAEAEFGLPQTVQALMASGDLRVSVTMSPDRWLGLTYAEDLPAVRANFSGAAAK